MLVGRLRMSNRAGSGLTAARRATAANLGKQTLILGLAITLRCGRPGRKADPR